MYDLNKFKSGYYYIKLETQSKYDDTMKWLDNLGLRWATGQKASLLNCWSGYDTCISYKYGSLGHQDESYYIREGFVKLNTRKYNGVFDELLWPDGSGRGDVPPIPKFTGNMYKSGRNPEIKSPKIYLGENEIDYGVSEFPDIQVDIDKLNKGVMSFMDSLGIFKKGELEMNETTRVNNIKQLHKDIKNIYFNETKKTTVIVFKNGDKVKATASKDTPFSEYAGFVTALFKYEKGLKLKDVEHLIKKKRG